MPQSKRLKNYIRSARKRAGLTQSELAYLLGGRGGKAVSRYEVFEREPMLPTALALEAALGVPARELFAGTCEEGMKTLQRRALVMDQQLWHKLSSPMVERKSQTIRRIMESCNRVSVTPSP